MLTTKAISAFVPVECVLFWSTETTIWHISSLSDMAATMSLQQYKCTFSLLSATSSNQCGGSLNQWRCSMFHLMTKVINLLTTIYF